MTNPTGMLPNPPAGEETDAIREDFRSMLRNMVGPEYAKALLVPAVPNNRYGVHFQNATTEASWRTYWLGRKGVGGVVDAQVHNPITAEGKVAAITHNIHQLLIDASEHTGESTGNLDVQKRAIEDQLRALVGLPPRQPQLEGMSDGWLDENAERAAIATLRAMAFTYHGGSRWKPPLGSTQRAEVVNGLIRRMKTKPGRYCISSVPLLAHGAMYFVEVDADGKVHQLTLEGERDGELGERWRGDEFTLDPRVIEEFPGGAPVFGGDQRAHVVCLCPDCTKPRPRPALRQTRTYVELGLSQAAHAEIAQKLRAAGYDHAFDGDTIDLHGLAAVLEGGS